MPLLATDPAIVRSLYRTFRAAGSPAAKALWGAKLCARGWDNPPADVVAFCARELAKR